jgi:hypothetical protein
LLSTLIDLGLLVMPSNKEDLASTDKAAKIEDPDILSNHNMSMDIVIRYGKTDHNLCLHLDLMLSIF